MMPSPRISEQAVKSLEVILPLQLMAVQQHFIHVLILKSWNAEEQARGIMAIDEVDLPNAMRIVDLLVSSGNMGSLSRCLDSQTGQMPIPGDSFEEIFIAERNIENRLTPALQTAEQKFLHQVVPGAVSRLITEPLIARPKFKYWLQSQEKNPLPENKAHCPLPDSAMSAINHYFAHLVIAINQELIHSFVHWHNGEHGLADTAWAASSGAMMQATAITKLLANRRLSAKPMQAIYSGGLPQKIVADSDAALHYGQELAMSCARSAAKAECLLDEPMLKAACKSGLAYFDQMSSWKFGQQLPKIENPCLDFKRILASYVWENSASKVTA